MLVWFAILTFLTLLGSATLLAYRWLTGTLHKPKGPPAPWVDIPLPRRPWPPNDGEVE